MHQKDPVRSALSFFHGKERGSDLRRLASERQWVASLNLTTCEKLIRRHAPELLPALVLPPAEHHRVEPQRYRRHHFPSRRGLGRGGLNPQGSSGGLLICPGRRAERKSPRPPPGHWGQSGPQGPLPRAPGVCSLGLSPVPIRFDFVPSMETVQVHCSRRQSLS